MRSTTPSEIRQLLRQRSELPDAETRARYYLQALDCLSQYLEEDGISEAEILEWMRLFTQTLLEDFMARRLENKVQGFDQRFNRFVERLTEVSN